MKCGIYELLHCINFDKNKVISSFSYNKLRYQKVLSDLIILVLTQSTS